MLVPTAMSSLLLDRAIFGSSSQGLIKGYQLLGWTPGIDGAICKELCLWSPTRLSQTGTPSPSNINWTAQAFPVGADRMCVGRTFASGKEYSGRGNAHIVSNFLVLDPLQWQAYSYDALGVVHAAMALGHLRMFQVPTTGILEKVVMPGVLPLASVTCFLDPYANCDSNSPRDQFPLEELSNRITAGDRLILVGLNRPLQVMASIIDLLDGTSRKRLSFTTGLPLSPQRPFQVHCLDACCYRQQLALAGWLSDAVYEF
jgi:hypothetical protein